MDEEGGIKKKIITKPKKTPEHLTRYAAVGSADESPIFSKNGTNPQIKAVSKANKNASMKLPQQILLLK